MVQLTLGGETRRTAHQMVRDTLRRAILDGSLSPGTRLVQAEIAEQLEVSTTPVREALRDLANEGLVHADAHRGAVVHETSLEELRDIYDVRRLLEPEAARRAVSNLTHEQIEQLDELHQRMLSETDSARWAEYNRMFHRTMTSAAGSRRLIDVLNRLEDAAMMYVGVAIRASQEHRNIAHEHHRQLVEAARKDDGEAAAEISRKHVSITLDTLT